ncbi:MAG: CpcT/CpeT family chromophore lyase [Planctomycetota bacterium]
MSRRALGIAALSLVMPAGLAAAQDMVDMQPNPQPAPEPWSPDWSSPEIAEAAGALIGAWSTSGEVAFRDAEGGSAVGMHILPVPIVGMADTLYAETFLLSDQAKPYRRSIMQFYETRSGVRLRTFEIAFGDESIGVFTGMGLLPDRFPQVSPDDLIATLDLEISTGRRGLRARTPHPYPTGIGVAVNMTSEIRVDGDRLTLSDTGFAADGSTAWGGEDVAFERTEPFYSVQDLGEGLFAIDLAEGGSDAVEQGDTLHVHYYGWRADGFTFDTSYRRGDAFRFAFPPRLIEGWNRGLNGVATGSHRKLVIPGALGYGPAGNPRANIPGDATLIFDIEILLVQKPAPAEDAAGGE